MYYTMETIDIHCYQNKSFLLLVNKLINIAFNYKIKY